MSGHFHFPLTLPRRKRGPRRHRTEGWVGETMKFGEERICQATEQENGRTLPYRSGVPVKLTPCNLVDVNVSGKYLAVHWSTL
jgi:hypothetical protein